MKKQTTKFTKQDKEKIENRLLAIFATALGAEMICLYLINWFRGSAGFMNAARWTCYILLIVFIALSVFLKVKSNKLTEQNQMERAAKYNNWFWVCLATAICAFLIYPTEIIGWIPGIGLPVVRAINSFNFFLGNPVCTRIFVVMVAAGVYTLVAFIYYGILSHKAHKASMNKGTK